MLDTLKFVRGAVSSKDLVPVLTHFHIRDGRLQGQNGRVTIEAPCPQLAGLDVVVPADKFLRAVDACDGEPKITVKDGKMTVSRKRFRATLAVLGVDEYPEVSRTIDCGPDFQRSGEGLINLLRKAQPFVSTDASRPWSCSVLITEDTAFATNNVVLACFDFDWTKENLVLPDFAIDELLRIGIDPTWVGWDSKHFVAEYADGSWLSSRLVDGAWPDSLRALERTCREETDWLAVPGDMVDALAKLKPFFPNAKLPIVKLDSEGISTSEGQSSAVVGMEGLPPSAFRLESLSLVVSAARAWNPARYPGPVPWRADGVVGMLSGVRV